MTDRHGTFHDLHTWQAQPRPPGRARCTRCGACRQGFRSDQLAEAHRSDEAGTTLFRAPEGLPAGWRIRSGPCVPREGSLPPLLAEIAQFPARAAWTEVPLARWGGE